MAGSQCVELSYWKCCYVYFPVCGNKKLSNDNAKPTQYSTQNIRIETTNQATPVTKQGRPTRQKDMIVIVRGREQSHSSNNSAGYNSIGKIFILLTSVLPLLNIL